MLPDFLSFWGWQHQKRSKSARFPQLSNLTTSKTKQFSETSSFFFTWQHQKRSNSARLPSKMECWVQRCWPRTNAFCKFSTKVLRLPRKSDARSYSCEVLHLSRKILANLKIGCSKMQTFSGNQLPDFLTSLINTSLVLRLPCEMHLCRSSSNVPRLPSFFGNAWKCYKTFSICSILARCRTPCACHAKQHLNVQKWSEHAVFLTFWLGNVLRATTACTFSTCQLPKVVRECCAVRHWGVFCTFWLGNVLRARTACTFSTSRLPEVLRTWCVLHILTSKCASRHNGVQFLISHLAGWLRTCRFSEPTFGPAGATNHIVGSLTSKPLSAM